MSEKPAIEIYYCPKCNWLLRAAWIAQELLSTFEDDLASVALVPSAESGRFEITLSGEVIWDRKVDDGFPSAKDIKQRVRDKIAPTRDLGHLDR
ncbi:MAG: SelT/SelW/SelH family protein [bacterium]